MDPFYQTRDANADVESPVFSFDKVDVRMSFIRKVYLILSVQLLLTAAFVVASVHSDSYKLFLVSNKWLIVVAAIVNIVCGYALICYRSLARSVPTNYLLLTAFTVTEAYFVSAITLAAEPEMVLVAACLTAGIVVSLTLYAITTKTDFTMMGGLLFMLGMTLLLGGLMLHFTNAKTPHLLMACFAVLLFGLYLIYDTQLIVGGRAHQLEIDDYILGALMLYIDIVRIFIEVLRILNMANERRN